MTRQFYEGYPKLYDGYKNKIDCNNPIINDDLKCECDKPCDVSKTDTCKCQPLCQEKCEVAHEDKCDDKKNACECYCETPCSTPCKGSNNFLSSLGLDSIFDNCQIDDIILIAIAIVLLHDGTDDTLLLIIIGILFFVGLT